ncbi:MAG: hypothetical protein ABSF98_28305 [Bryobacteraceae bacterium]
MKRTYLVAFVMLVPLSPVWRASAADLMCPEPSAGGSGQPACGLGTRWNVVAGCWPGVYTRRGSSNVFDAQMTQVNGDRYAAVVVVSINGNQVSATQTDLAGEPCYLRNGVLNPDGRTVTGTYECHPFGKPVVTGCFIGAIQCDGLPPGPPPALPDISGTWYSQTRAWVYQFTQNGSQFAWSRNPPEAASGTLTVTPGASSSLATLYADWKTGRGYGRVVAVDSKNRATRLQWDNGQVFVRTPR